MTNPWIVSRAPLLLLASALLFGIADAGVLALRLARGLSAWPPVAVAAGALVALAAIAWLARARAARRLSVALDVYADRELARSRPVARRPFSN
jgi:hypothetical protein